jgi:hypothetical protein
MDKPKFGPKFPIINVFCWRLTLILALIELACIIDFLIAPSIITLRLVICIDRLRAGTNFLSAQAGVPDYDSITNDILKTLPPTQQTDTTQQTGKYRLDEAIQAARTLGVKTRKEYYQRYKEDPRLPSDPSHHYMVSWSYFLGEASNPLC